MGSAVAFGDAPLSKRGDHRTVNNNTQITATVPAGATTGPISVTTPGGTAISAGNFTVTSGFNDHFANGQVLSGSFGNFNGSTVGATKEAGEPNHAGNVGARSIWYYWTAPGSGPVTFDTIGSDFDTLLGIYTGSSVGALSLIVSNDDIVPGVNQQSLASFSAVAGTTYRIAVDGFAGAFGNVVLNWTVRPANDNFANGLVVSGSAGSVSRSSVGATKEPGEPNHAGNTGGRSVWYYWTAPSSGSVAATAYRIAVDGFDGAFGNVALNWAPTPSNDNFVNGQVITGSVGSVNGSNVGATKEANEPDHAANPGGNSIWYYWTAPSNRRQRHAVGVHRGDGRLVRAEAEGFTEILGHRADVLHVLGLCLEAPLMNGQPGHRDQEILRPRHRTTRQSLRHSSI